MSSPHTISRARALLKEMLGPEAQFRAGQLEAIEAVVERRGRALVVQRTPEVIRVVCSKIRAPSGR